MKIKYRIFFLALIVSFLTFPVHSNAAELPRLASGYTEDGVFYEIFGESPMSQSSLTRYAMRTVVYQGKITPQRQIPWEETINGIKYSRTLSLRRFHYDPEENTTTVTYEGILTVV